MEIHELEQKFREAVYKIEEKGKAYADAKSMSNYLYEQKKVVFSDAFKRSEGKTIAEREANAFTDESYRNHLEGLKEAEGESLRLEAEYKRWLSQFEAIRSLISLEKEKPTIQIWHLSGSQNSIELSCAPTVTRVGSNYYAHV